MRRLLATLVLLSAAACSERKTTEEAPAGPADLADANSGKPKSIEEMRAESLAGIDREACERDGGEVRQEGMLGLYRCVKPYADAGKPCRGKADCEGQCRYDGAPPAENEEVTGACQRDDSPFGCYSEVEGGKVTGGLCVD